MEAGRAPDTVVGSAVRSAGWAKPGPGSQRAQGGVIPGRWQVGL